MAIGRLSGDASDVLEGVVLSNKTLTDAQLVRLLKVDDFVGDEIRDFSISDAELLEYVSDTKLVYKI
jgi:hypothetical protein